MEEIIIQNVINSIEKNTKHPDKIIREKILATLPNLNGHSFSYGYDPSDPMRERYFLKVEGPYMEKTFTNYTE